MAGTGTAGYNGTNIAATAAELYSPAGLALDASGDLFIADEDNQRVREVNAATGIITTIIGTGTLGFNGNGSLATAAELKYPEGVAVDSSGDVFIGDTQNYRVREVNHVTGVIATIAGNGTEASSGCGGQATATEFDWARGNCLGFGRGRLHRRYGQ